MKTIEVHHRKQETMIDTKGKKVTAGRNITFENEISEEELLQMMEEPNIN